MPRREYPRTERLNQLLREIMAEALEHVDDDRIANVTITDVDVDAELSRAIVYFDPLDEEADDDVLEAFAEHEWQLKRAIGQEARIRKTPRLEFHPDLTLRSADRIVSILDGLEIPEE